MNGKKIFGIVMAMLMIIGISAATLVYYESNVVETETVVESPIVLEMMEEGGLPSTFYAGSCEYVTVSGEYKANRPTLTVPLVVIGCDDPNVDMDPSEVATCGGAMTPFGEEGSNIREISFSFTIDGDESPLAQGNLVVNDYGNYLYAIYDEPGIWCDPADPKASATIDMMLHPEVVPAGYWVKIVCISPPAEGHDTLTEALEDLTGYTYLG